MKYFLVRETMFLVVRAETEDQALRDSRCPLHSQHCSGNSHCYFLEPIEAEDAWKASAIFHEKLSMEKSK